MGVLKNHSSNTTIYLGVVHTMGRDPLVCDTLLDNPSCSRLHCTIRWENGHYLITDQSKNGTSVNGTRLPRGDSRILSINDMIELPGGRGERYCLTDDAQPGPVLLTSDKSRFIPLNLSNILPSEREPELLITRQTNGWIVEQGVKAQDLSAEDPIIFADQTWHFFPNDVLDETLPILEPHNDHKNALTLTFDISLNEEHIRLCITSAGVTHDFGIKVHHYFMMLLARYRIADASNNVPFSEQGWTNTDVLLDDLGIDATHLNTLIYRARKSFSVMGQDIALSLLERRLGELRLNAKYLKLNKGDKQQSCSLSA